MNGTVWCIVVVQIWFVSTACLMDVSVDTKMWLIFIVVENVTERELHPQVENWPLIRSNVGGHVDLPSGSNESVVLG